MQLNEKYRHCAFFLQSHIFHGVCGPYGTVGAFAYVGRLERAEDRLMISVITNADDFGLTEGGCAAIVKAIYAGGLTATTAMVCVPRATMRLRKWARFIPGRIGAHLQLTGGSPILPPEQIPSLVEANGQFPAKRRGLCAPKTAEIFAEWCAQMEVLLRTGIEPTHLDTHHHVHCLPEAAPAFIEIATRYKLPARALDPEMSRSLREIGLLCVDRTLTDWYGGELSVRTLVKVVADAARELPEARCFEVMCHPAFVDEELIKRSGYVEEREMELIALCDPALPRELGDAGFSLSGFESLQTAT
jgi:hypothetical protein